MVLEERHSFLFSVKRTVLEGEGWQVLAVPGAYCPEYRRQEIHNRLVVELRDGKCC